MNSGSGSKLWDDRKPKDQSLHPRLQAPSAAAVVLCLVAQYISICGFLTFYLTQDALILALVLIVLAAIPGFELQARRYPSAPWLLLLGGISATFAVAIGLLNHYGLYEPYSSVKESRRYEEVSGIAKASAHQDAGLIEFAADAVVDELRAVGQRGYGHVFCVAPIVSNAVVVPWNSSGPNVEFWAVGLDCCAPRGDFQCAGGQVGVHGGIAIHQARNSFLSDLLSPRTYRDEYLRAVAAAGALHDLDTAENPVLVQWESRPERLIRGWLVSSILVLTLTSAAHCIGMSLVWGAVHEHYDGKVRRLVDALHSRVSGQGDDQSVGAEFASVGQPDVRGSGPNLPPASALQPQSRRLLRDPFLLGSAAP